MANYLAKRAALGEVKECNERNCGCYTSSGYYIKYKNRNVDTVLFVCEECFSRKYRSMCTLGEFQETEYVRNYQRNPYHLSNSTLRKVAVVFNKVVHFTRVVLILVLILLFTTFFVKEQPFVRENFDMSEINTVTQKIHDCCESIGIQIYRVFIYGGKND